MARGIDNPYRSQPSIMVFPGSARIIVYLNCVISVGTAGNSS